MINLMGTNFKMKEVHLKDPTHLQCDQIGRFLKVLDVKFSYKSCLNICWVFDYFEKVIFELTTAVITYWAPFEIIGRLLILTSDHTAHLLVSSFLVLLNFDLKLFLLFKMIYFLFQLRRNLDCLDFLQKVA